MAKQKLSELAQDSNTTSSTKVPIITSDGDMKYDTIERLVKNAIYSSESGKGSVICNIIVGIIQISTTKGEVVCLCLDNRKGFLLGDTQHYTTNEGSAIDNKKIFVNTATGSDYIDICDYTDENLTITVNAIGFSAYAF